MNKGDDNLLDITIDDIKRCVSERGTILPFCDCTCGNYESVFDPCPQICRINKIYARIYTIRKYIWSNKFISDIIYKEIFKKVVVIDDEDDELFCLICMEEPGKYAVCHRQNQCSGLLCVMCYQKQKTCIICNAPFISFK